MSKTAFSAWFAAAMWAASSATVAAQDEAAQEEGALELSSSQMGEVSADGGGAGGGAGPGPLRFHGGLRLGFGGSLELEPEGGGFSVEEDLVTTIGLQAGADYVLMDYFALGGELRLGWLNTEGGDDADSDRLLLVDIAVKPRGRYMLEDIGLEVYGTLPVGLTIPSFPDDYNVDGQVGFNLGIGAGATYFFTDRIGVNSEMMWLMHWFGGESGGVGGGEGDFSTGQFSWFVNGVFAL